MSMTPSIDCPDVAARRFSAASGEHRQPGQGGAAIHAEVKVRKEARDTAEGCRDRATADLIQAVTMGTANARRRLEISAASWTTRAELLRRIESGAEARRAAPELTLVEAAEDAAFAQLQTS
jgi:hypothetical protein